MSEDTGKQEIVRSWTGWVATSDRDAYADYVEETGMAHYRRTPGNLDAWLLLRDLEDQTTEVVTISRWESLDAIRAFAGEDLERAVYYPEDDRYLVRREMTVRHYVRYR